MGQPFIFVREGERLSPAEQWTHERLLGFPEGKHLKADKIVQPRSLPFQGFYWVHLSNICKATNCAATAEHLHKAILKLAGYVAPVYDIHGKIIEIAPDSTAFDKMDQPAFNKYVDTAQFILAEKLGVNWSDYGRSAA